MTRARRRPPIRLLVVPDSSNIQAVGYLRDQQLLRVRFRDGSEYEYAGISAARYTELVSAASIGVYFAANIRGKYESTRRKRPRTRAHAS